MYGPIKMNKGIVLRSSFLKWMKTLFSRYCVSVVSRMHVTWSKPTIGWYKLNTDGSFYRLEGRGAVWWLDANFCLKLAAELMVIKWGMQKACDDGIPKSEVEVDSQLIIKTLNEEEDPPWRLLTLFRSIWNLSDYFDECTFCHVFREGNKSSNWLAHFAYSFKTSLIWRSSHSVHVFRQ